MTRRSSGTAIALAIALTVTAGIAPAQGVPDGFPHERHAKLFPVCEGCHAGIVSGVARDAFPRPADCQRCHDGVRERRVAWSSRTPRVSNLRFSHPAHAAETAREGPSPACAACHATSEPPRRMAVAGPDPVRCVRCHTNPSGEHLARDAACATCHVTLAAQPRLPSDRIARFPRPAWHDSSGFEPDHGRVTEAESGSCAVCHARESCQRCHANAERVPLIVSLASDARVAALVRGREARYGTPASHRDRGWSLSHGRPTPVAAGCANCHTQTSCTVCHRQGYGTSRDAIRALPAASAHSMLGVPPERITTKVHPGDIGTRHGPTSATGGLRCAQCHAEAQCASCHSGSESRRFHARNFVERHAVDVFSSAADCQSCHNNERFCRDCHTRTGVASSGQMKAAFHTGLPTWVLSHGQAARMGMESCAACHRQADCVRCHSASGGWGINPHRSGYPASSIGERSTASCRWCHLGAPPGVRR